MTYGTDFRQKIDGERMGARNGSLLRLSQRAGVGLVAEGGLCEAPYNVM